MKKSKRIVYGVLLVVGVAALSAAIKPVQKILTPFDVVVAELRDELVQSCTSKICAEEAKNMRIGFGLYTSEERVTCPHTFMHQPLEGLSGTYCVDIAIYQKESRQHAEGKQTLSSFWIEKNARYK